MNKLKPDRRNSYGFLQGSKVFAGFEIPSASRHLISALKAQGGIVYHLSWGFLEITSEVVNFYTRNFLLFLKFNAK